MGSEMCIRDSHSDLGGLPQIFPPSGDLAGSQKGRLWASWRPSESPKRDPERFSEKDPQNEPFLIPSWRAQVGSRLGDSTVSRFQDGPFWDAFWSHFGVTLGSQEATIVAKGLSEAASRDGQISTLVSGANCLGGPPPLARRRHHLRCPATSALGANLKRKMKGTLM